MLREAGAGGAKRLVTPSVKSSKLITTTMLADGQAYNTPAIIVLTSISVVLMLICLVFAILVFVKKKRRNSIYVTSDSYRFPLIPRSISALTEETCISENHSNCPSAYELEALAFGKSSHRGDNLGLEVLPTARPESRRARFGRAVRTKWRPERRSTSDYVLSSSTASYANCNDATVTIVDSDNAATNPACEDDARIL